MSNALRCPNGHFYDPTKYASCPFCGPNGIRIPSVRNPAAMPSIPDYNQNRGSNFEDDERTVSINAFNQSNGGYEDIGRTVAMDQFSSRPSAPPDFEDDEKTVAMSSFDDDDIGKTVAMDQFSYAPSAPSDFDDDEKTVAMSSFDDDDIGKTVAMDQFSSRPSAPAAFEDDDIGKTVAMDQFSSQPAAPAPFESEEKTAEVSFSGDTDNVFPASEPETFVEPAGASAREPLPDTGFASPAEVFDEPAKESVFEAAAFTNTQPVTDKPVTGWMVCVSGELKGAMCTLYEGENYIVLEETGLKTVLSDEDCDEYSCVISYIPETRSFRASRGNAGELCYIGNEIVLDSLDINAYDNIEVGDQMLLFIPLCGERFSWDDYR